MQVWLKTKKRKERQRRHEPCGTNEGNSTSVVWSIKHWAELEMLTARLMAVRLGAANEEWSLIIEQTSLH